jgi:flagellar hook-associated protein 2
MQVSINRTTDTYTATYIDAASGSQTVSLSANPITGGGVGLKGPTGSALDGMEFVYAGTGNATVNVTLTQGFADRLYNLMDSFTNTKDGTLTNELTTLSDTKTRNTTEVTKVDDKITTYRDQLTQQYANLEAALSKANNLLQLLDAQSKARSSGG